MKFDSSISKLKFLFTQKKQIVGEEWDKFTLLTMGKSGVKPRDMDAGGKFPESFETYQKVNTNEIVFCLFDIDEIHNIHSIDCTNVFLCIHMRPYHKNHRFQLVLP